VLRIRTFLVESGRLGPDPDPALMNDSLSTFLSVFKSHKYLGNLYFLRTVLRSRIIFMRLRLRAKILMRLRLLPYCIARQNFSNELKFKHMLKHVHMILYDFYW
jgi:hypothetical protein